MGYYDIRQISLFLAANDKRPAHLMYPFVGKPWPINHCQHRSGLPPPGVGNLWLCSPPLRQYPSSSRPTSHLRCGQVEVRGGGHLTLKLVCESHLRWGTFLPNLGRYARPLGSRIFAIRRRTHKQTDRRTNKSNAYCPFPTGGA